MSTIQVTGASLDEIAKALGWEEVEKVDLGSFSTEELLAEVRERLVQAKPPQVVKIVPWADGPEAGEPAAVADKPKRGRPAGSKNVSKGPKAEAAPGPPEAEPETTEDWDGDGGDETEADTAKYTMDDVRKTLDAAKDIIGMVTARGIMAEVGGSSKLIDIDASKYGALIAGLNTAVAKAKKNQAAA